MFFALVLPLALSLFSVASADRPADALTLLTEVSEHYADAKSYHIEAVEERNSETELSRSWQKSVMTAIVMPGGRFRYEGLSLIGKVLLVSDGVHEWVYIPERRAYTQQDVSTAESDKTKVHAPEEVTARNAKLMIVTLVQGAGVLKSASYLPDDTIVVGEKKIDCYVVQVSEADFKVHPYLTNRKLMFWIDKSRHVIVRKTDKQSPTQQNPEHPWRTMTSDVVTTYSVVDLNAHEPESSFTFTAPKDSVLVQDFGAPGIRIDWLMGKLAPEIRFRGPDGKIMTLSELQGKPVFLDFWASWCGPCNSAIPDLLKLYADTSPKGLTWIGIDNDTNPDAAEKFLKERGIPWPNYHDLDGSMGAAFERHAVPLGVLLDAKGKIIFYKPVYQVSELRGAIATLGPQFAEAVGTGAN